MPRPKVKAGPSRSRKDDSDEELPETQTTMTQVEKTLKALTLEEKERKINDLVQFLLIMDLKKMPIKRQDINKHVLKEHSRAFPEFIKKAAEKLAKVFGIELVEMPQMPNKQKSYILVNMLETDVDDPHLQWPPDDNARLGLIMVVLSIIFMCHNTIEETKLYMTLKKLGVDVDQPHEVFGDVKKFISQDLVKMGYVVHERQGHSDPPTYEYKWGARAQAETSKRNVLDFVCQVYGQDDPSIWTSQWQDMLRSEGQLAEDTATA